MPARTQERGKGFHVALGEGHSTELSQVPGSGPGVTEVVSSPNVTAQYRGVGGAGGAVPNWKTCARGNIFLSGQLYKEGQQGPISEPRILEKTRGSLQVQVLCFSDI